MTLLPRRPVAVETALAPAAVRAGIAPAVALVNGTALVVQLRSEVDGPEVRVGWWPAMAFTRGGIWFEGTVQARGAGAVLTGEIAFSPPSYARQAAAIYVVVGLVPLLALGALGV